MIVEDQKLHLSKYNSEVKKSAPLQPIIKTPNIMQKKLDMQMETSIVQPLDPSDYQEPIINTHQEPIIKTRGPSQNIFAKKRNLP